MTRIIGDDERRFLSYVNKNGPVAKNRPDLGRCWLWTGSKRSTKYGGFRCGKKLWGAHRWAYEHWAGPIDPDMVLDHFACDNPPCVNPAHLKPTTHWDNNRRGNSATAKAARQTHCVNGHEFTEANTYRRPDAPHTRSCRRCKADRERIRRQRT